VLARLQGPSKAGGFSASSASLRARALPDRLQPELREDRPQGTNARRQRIVIVGDGAGQEGRERVGLPVVESRCGIPNDMGSLTASVNLLGIGADQAARAPAEFHNPESSPSSHCIVPS